MNKPSSPTLFFKQFRQDFFHTGAVLPSSPWLGRAAAAYLAQKQGPARELEVGAGTGAFTREIIPCLQPGDALDMVEINRGLMEHLQQRFRCEAAFESPGVEIRFLTIDVRQLPANGYYDYIIFSLPLTNFPPALVQEILELMMARLNPGGVFSFVKYIFISRFKYLFGGAKIRAAMHANQQIINAFAAQYQFERRAVWRNMPPAWTYYWQKSGQINPSLF
jgi:phospholipid N-methyltransferase